MYFLVGFDPAGCDLVLDGFQVDLPAADEVVQSSLEHVFHMGVPWSVTAKGSRSSWNSEIRVIVRFPGGDPVSRIGLFLEVRGNGPHLLRVAHPESTIAASWLDLRVKVANRACRLQQRSEM